MEWIEQFVSEATASGGHTAFSVVGGMILFLLLALTRRLVAGHLGGDRAPPSPTARRVLEVVQNANLDTAKAGTFSVTVPGRGATARVNTKTGAASVVSHDTGTEQDVAGLSRPERRLIRQAARDLKARLEERDRDNHAIAQAALLKLL